MIVLARTGLSEKSRPLVSVRRIMICKTVGSRTMEPLIPSVLGLLALVLAACSNGTPSAPTAQPPSEETTPTVGPTSTVISGPLGPQRTSPSLLSAPRQRLQLPRPRSPPLLLPRTRIRRGRHPPHSQPLRQKSRRRKLWHTPICHHPHCQRPSRPGRTPWCA